MGNAIVNEMKRMGLVKKITLATVLTFLFSLLLYEGWQNPRGIFAGTGSVTKTYLYATTSETWTGLFATAETTGTSNLGYLTTKVTGRKVTDATAGWELTGVTWETLGVPAGATVNSVDGSYSWYCSQYLTGAASNSGDLTITDAANANAATLEAGVAFSATTTTAARNASAAIAIPAAIQPSASAIKVRLLGSIVTGNSGTASVTRVSDNVSLTINYTTTVSLLTLPTATTIADTTATLGATVSNNGGALLTDYGIVWNTAGAPTLATGTKVQKGTTNFTGAYSSAVTGLPVGTRVYYAGYATNSNGTAYSPIGSFYTAPTTQASNVLFSGVTSTGMTVSWTNGSGDGALVLMFAGSAVTGAPADGTYSYIASTTYGSGTSIPNGVTIYKGAGSSVTVSGLTNGTTYHVAVFASAGASTTSGVNQGTNYINTSPATGSQTAQNVFPVIGTVTVTPSSGSYTSSAPTVSASVTLVSGAPSGCEYTTDGSIWNSGTLTGSVSPWTCSASTSGLSGANSFNIRATSIGGTGTGAAVPLTVDSVSPVITLQGPADGASIAKADVRLTGTATDTGGSGVAQYKIDLYDGSHVYMTGTGWTAYTGPISYDPTASLAYSSPYYWTLSFKDGVGNITNATERIFSTMGACVRVTPTLSLATPLDAISTKILTDAGSAVYRLRIYNNDVGGCGDTTFNLTAANTFDVGADAPKFISPPTLASGTAVVSPGSYQDINLTVTSVTAGGADVSGVAKSTVTATAATHTNATSNLVLTVLNVAGCVKNAALLNIGPDKAYATRGGSIVYTVSVKNADVGANCTASTFAVTKISDSNGNFSSSLSTGSLVLLPGQASTVLLTTASNGSATNGSSNIATVGVSEAGHPATANKTATTTIGDMMLHNSDNLASTKHSGGGWGIPGGRYGEFVCNTCHVPGGSDTTNIKRIRQAIYTPYTTGGAPKLPGHGETIDFRKIVAVPGTSLTKSTDPSYGWDNTTAKLTSPKKVCEVCHSPDATQVAGTKFHSRTASSLPSHYDGRDCIECHKHRAAFGTAGMACNACHGDSAVGTIDATNRYAVAPPKNASGVTGTLTGTGLVSNNPKVGAHQTHLRFTNGFSNYSTVDFRCEGCHGTPLPNNTAHMNGSSPMAFQGMATRGGMSSPAFSSGNLTCSSTYCHNPAASTVLKNAGNTGSNVFPSWTGAKYLGDTRKTQANCGVCHKVPGDVNFQPASTHSSVPNVLSACTSCHGHEGDNSGTTVGQRHMDGILYGGGDCDSCHAYDVGSWAAKAERSVVPEGKGAHEKHIAYLKLRYGVTLSPTTDQFGSAAASWTNVCGVCHNGATHTTGESIPGTGRNISIKTSYWFGPGAGTPSYNGAIGVSSATTAKSCSNVSCHYMTSPVWSTY